MTVEEERLQRRRLLILRFGAETQEEALNLASRLDPGHPVTQELLGIAERARRLGELLERPVPGASDA